MQKHVWETVEITLTAQNEYENPYMQVGVWADLTGPGFQKRCYGFWDGGSTFRIRICATCAGDWAYTVGSNTQDPGLNGESYSFSAMGWTEEEKLENPCRRGMVVATPNQHGFMYSDGTLVYILADTVWAAFTYRYPLYDDETPRKIGPGLGLKDVIRVRKQQGFNAIATISAFVGWQDDGHPSRIALEDGTVLRDGWRTPGISKKSDGHSIKDMHSDSGERPFLFPGKIPGYEQVFPDMEQVNPLYFQDLDKKMNWLNSQGITVFMETVRRDCSTAWKKYYSWPDSFTRYVQYLFARYQANNCLYSPIHYDYDQASIPGRDYNEPINLAIDRQGKPPFGTICGCNANGTTLADFGHTDVARWLGFHQIGNFDRVHDQYWYLTQIHQLKDPVPALNGEPYYPGDMFGGGPDDVRVYPDCLEANYRFRSGLYGSLLSGGLAGYFYGANGMWGGDIEPESTFKIWDALGYSSGSQVQHVNAFLQPLEGRYAELIPDVELVTPNKAGDPQGFHGWAYCARTGDYSTLLLYCEAHCPRVDVRGLEYGAEYELLWFDPREGKWMEDATVRTIATDCRCRLRLPVFPNEKDWGILLRKVGP